MKRDQGNDDTRLHNYTIKQLEQEFGESSAEFLNKILL